VVKLLAVTGHHLEVLCLLRVKERKLFSGKFWREKVWLLQLSLSEDFLIGLTDSLCSLFFPAMELVTDLCDLEV
jgi:hypothetical protein